MTIKLANNATSRLAVSISSSDTQFSVSPGEGSRFPSLSPGDWFPLTLVKSNGELEIVKCTARSGDIFTVERAQEGTAAKNFDVNDRAELRITEKTLEEKFTQPIAEALQAASEAEQASESSLKKSSNLSDLDNPSEARSNLELGTAATESAQSLSTDYYGPTAPSTTFAGMTWADSTNLLIKRRNTSNNAWIVEGTLFKASLPQYAEADIPTADKGPIYVVGKGSYEWDAGTSAYKVLAVTEEKIADGAVTGSKIASDAFGALTEVNVDSSDFVILIDSSDANKTKKIPATQVMPAPSFEAGTKLSFYQANAPTGWTKIVDSALNDSILRIVNGSGGTTGGATAFSTFNAQTSVGATTLAISQIPSHGHSYTAVEAGSGLVVIDTSYGGNVNSLRSDQTTGSNGGSGSHTHSLTCNIKYADFIVASKN